MCDLLDKNVKCRDSCSVFLLKYEHIKGKPNFHLVLIFVGAISVDSISNTASVQNKTIITPCWPVERPRAARVTTTFPHCYPEIMK